MRPAAARASSSSARARSFFALTRYSTRTSLAPASAAAGGRGAEVLGQRPDRPDAGPAGDEQHLSPSRGGRGEVPERTLGEHRHPGAQAGHRAAVVAGVLDGQPQPVVGRRRRERVRVRRPDVARRDEAPEEELPGPATEPVQVPAADPHGHDAVGLRHHLLHQHGVVHPAPHRARDTPPEHRHGDRRVHRGPRSHRSTVCRASLPTKSAPVLVWWKNAERHGEVGADVQPVPGLVGQPPAQSRAGGDPHEEEEAQPGGRLEHVGIGGRDGPALADDLLVRGQAVALDDEQHVRAQQQDDVGAQAAVPRGQPVQADGPLEPGQAGHEQQLHQDEVAAEEPGHPADRRHLGAEAGQRVRRGAEPPQRADREPAAQERGADGEVSALIGGGARRRRRRSAARGRTCRTGAVMPPTVPSRSQSDLRIAAAPSGRSG